MSSVAFWSDVASTVIGAGVGAFLAFELERRRRKGEQHRQEIGRCHQLACLLVNRLSVLEEFYEDLFLSFEKEHGQPPKWEEVPALDGAPERTDGIPIDDYTFLIDGREHKSSAPALLRKVQLSTINTDALFDRLARRNRLWHEYQDAHMGPILQRGEMAAAALGRGLGLERDLRELTTWVRKDLEEEIAALREIFDVFYSVMHEHYPKEEILTFKSIAGGPPLGLAGGAAPPPTA